jgi:hypothetical protein
METFLLLIAVCFAFGVFGGVLIGKRALPERRGMATLWWVGTFFVCLAIVLVMDGDPALSGEAARRNAPFASVLYGILLGGPWLVGTLAGRAVGKALRGKETR